MLSYTHDQAIELLKSKLEVARQTLVNVKDDLEFLREQVSDLHTSSTIT